MVVRKSRQAASQPLPNKQKRPKTKACGYSNLHETTVVAAYCFSRDTNHICMQTTSNLLRSIITTFSLFSPVSIAAYTAAPCATASSALMQRLSCLPPKNSDSICCNLGMRVEPPTNTTSSTCTVVDNYRCCTWMDATSRWMLHVEIVAQDFANEAWWASTECSKQK